MAGSIIVSSITLDSDNNFSIKSNTGATLFFANTTGIDIANSIGATAITNDKILSVANTKISGNIISSQITSNPTLYGNVSVVGTASIGASDAIMTIGDNRRTVSTSTTTGAIVSGGGLGVWSDAYIGGNLSVAGGQIKFPATQSASADANTLDDYEEGTFTPTAYGSSTAGTTTYTVQQGSYTKIGRQVTVSTRIDYSAFTGTGELRFGSFPFTSANDSMEYTGAVVTNNLNWTSGSAIGIYYPPNSTYCVIFNIGDDLSWGGQLCTSESAGMRMTFTYFI